MLDVTFEVSICTGVPMFAYPDNVFVTLPSPCITLLITKALLFKLLFVVSANLTYLPLSTLAILFVALASCSTEICIVPLPNTFA